MNTNLGFLSHLESSFWTTPHLKRLYLTLCMCSILNTYYLAIILLYVDTYWPTMNFRPLNFNPLIMCIISLIVKFAIWSMDKYVGTNFDLDLKWKSNVHKSSYTWFYFVYFMCQFFVYLALISFSFSFSFFHYITYFNCNLVICFWHSHNFSSLNFLSLSSLHNPPTTSINSKNIKWLFFGARNDHVGNIVNQKRFRTHKEQPCEQGEWGNSWGIGWDEVLFCPPSMGRQLFKANWLSCLELLPIFGE